MGIEVRAVALAMVAAGYSVLPIALNSKRPAIHSWTPYQALRMSTADIEREFSKDVQIAVICGAISGCLEVIDFDLPKGGNIDHFKQFMALCRDFDRADLIKRLAIAETPSGGRHLFYRCPEGVESNKKLAENTNREVLIETRGDGGYVLVAPSSGYAWKQGGFESIPTITQDDRKFLLGIAAMLSEKVREVYQYERVSAPLMTGDRPGDVYSDRASAAELLTKHGWQFQRNGGKRSYWVRPGKDTKGEPSGTLTNDHPPTFFCFSTNAAPLENDKGYSPFSLFVALEHGGVVSAAARAAAEMFGMATVKADPNKPKFEKPTYKTQAPIEDIDDFFGATPLENFGEVDVKFGVCGKYIRAGQLNLLDAEGGIGKSTLLLMIAANLSRGIDPIGEYVGVSAPSPAKTLYFTTEDSGEEIRSVYQNFGGLPGYVKHIAKPMAMDESALVALEKLIVREGVRLVVFDPGITYMKPGSNVNDPKAVNEFCSGLRGVAMRTGAAILIVRHFNKGALGKKDKPDVKAMGAGAMQWRDSVRSQLVMCWHPKAKGVRCIFHAKASMVVETQPPFGFHRDGGGIGLIFHDSHYFTQLEDAA
jgi:hypothetical protein